MKPVLVIMAAGMGSRYGSKKQIDPIDEAGNVIVDYSIYDAKEAGFEKVIFIIKEEDEEAFEDAIGRRIRPFIEVAYVYQQIDNLPDGFTRPVDRVKPWGTGHAVLCLKDKLEAPFAVINADDFYGRKAYRILYDFLSKGTIDSSNYLMVGYQLSKTVTDHGSVSRGICTIDSKGLLIDVVEETHIEKGNDATIFCVNQETGARNDLVADTLVSMNMWGFFPKFLSQLEDQFLPFLETTAISNPLKGEYYLPMVVDGLLKSGGATVTVKPSDDRWYGVTYAEDKKGVVEAIAGLKASGIYPDQLWA